MTNQIRIAVLGASGYTGADAVRLALGHPQLEIAALGANAKAGSAMPDIWPHFTPYKLPMLQAAADIDFGDIDAVISCLPHGTSADLLAQIKGPRIIDLSADYRLRDAQTYADWYGRAHPVPDDLPDAVYGLTEFARHRLPDAELAACPGCYPTAALLALLPGIGDGIVSPRNISIMAMSGVTGAGRGAKEANLFAEVSEAAHPYGLAGHRHMPEIEQELSNAANTDVTVSFIPHLLPMNRGELETITVELAEGSSTADLRRCIGARYEDEPFVHLLPEGRAPATRMVRGSNHCVLNVFPDRVPGRAIIVAAIDNLVKGSAGQAIQNLNVMFGLSETAGLEQAPLFP
ncbi:N-acetyl-gamma-glutamyl-phosphate reductase [Pacificimonas flava]|uniref:N-acetyl-gamma-glutamyl-phosphate reductase n=2 Tax=Pacificimonas TaxID=1960290 RepID=A0A219B9F9_9SPHN|nr:MULTISPECIES: N-acetyl-gamma-glutamyl-phosphate reductase [Pacificimonas]MBZ6378669.1 N-acetyl-gamma-glutamyl-phosphate reductase [Pacificimonas aurantium]OWV34756.1 N-acetyl-gamma-glutamyl-phosphate reductase [Pacificimonas flava]